MRRNFNGAVLAIFMAAASISPALARGNDFYINDGFGENVVIKNGFFGRKTEVIKDRFGDGFALKKGLFGTKEEDVNVLGNGFQRKKGIFGGSDIKGSTIFGDKIETKKGIFGRRTTYVDVSGGANALRALWNANKGKLGFGNPTATGGTGTGSQLGAPYDLGGSAAASAGAPPVGTPDTPGAPPANP